MKRIPNRRERLSIIGNGLATGRLLDRLCREAPGLFEITVFGEEPRGLYNRVLLSRVLGGASPETIELKPRDWYASHDVRFECGVRVTRVELERRQLVADRADPGGRDPVPFDRLVFATGSRAAVPRIPGLHADDRMLAGVFVFRTLEDCSALRAWLARPRRAVVLGGGLLGLEAAKGLADLGARVTVLDRGPGPMSRQLTASASQLLAQRLERIHIASRGPVQVKEVRGTEQIEAVVLDSGEHVPCDLLVLACGVEPRVELARGAGLEVRRGIVVDDRMSVPDHPGVYAVGECAEHDGEVYGVVAPIWLQVDALADALLGVSAPRRFTRQAPYTKLKVAGVEVASLGVVEPEHDDDEVVEVVERRRAIFRRLILREERIVGAHFVGDAAAAPRVGQLWQRGTRAPENRLDLLASDEARGGDAAPPELCSCNHVTEPTVITAIRQGSCSVRDVGEKTQAGTGCGSCRSRIERLLTTLAPGRAVAPLPELRLVVARNALEAARLHSVSETQMERADGALPHSESRVAGE
jgi:nitrite reductase (NADH) large subunit